MPTPSPDKPAHAKHRLAALFRKSPEMEGCDEIDALDLSLYGAATRLRRTLREPALPKGPAAILSPTLLRREIEALVMLLDLIDVPSREVPEAPSAQLQN